MRDSGQQEAPGVVGSTRGFLVYSLGPLCAGCEVFPGSLCGGAPDAVIVYSEGSLNGFDNPIVSGF